MTPHLIHTVGYWQLAAALTGLAAAISALRWMLRRDRTRREIRDLEHHINNPAVRAKYLNPPRKEER
jgi:hypothetical protein